MIHYYLRIYLFREMELWASSKFLVRYGVSVLSCIYSVSTQKFFRNATEMSSGPGDASFHDNKDSHNSSFVINVLIGSFFCMIRNRFDSLFSLILFMNEASQLLSEDDLLKLLASSSLTVVGYVSISLSIFNSLIKNVIMHQKLP